MENICLIYVTTSTEEEARNISQILLEKQLVACANISSPITSLYRWEGQIKNEKEVTLLLKTKNSLVEKVIQEVNTLHSYECPCIISWRVATAHEPFTKWINESVK